MGKTWLALVPLFAILIADARAWADAGTCPGVAVAVDDALRARWPGATEQVRAAFEARDDIDGCARVRLSAHRSRIAVDVMLPDGRMASRTLEQIEDVVPTLAALLLVPVPALSSPPTTTPPPPPPLAATTPAASALHDSPPPPRRAPTDQPAGVGFEFSLAACARAGDGQTGAGVGLLVSLDVMRWLIGFQARVDGYTHGAAVLELAATLGRRFQFDTLALDLSAGPALAMLGSSSTSAANPQDGVPAMAALEQSTHGLTPRMLIAARLNVGTDAVVRWFVGLEAELGATHGIGDELPSHIPRLPVWTAGLALGATLGTL